MVGLLLLLVGLTTGAPSFAPRLSEVEWSSYHEREPQGPGTYTFGYDVEDPESGNIQFRQEERFPNGTVEGSYGSVQPDGNIQVVHYVADHRGYRARIENSLRRHENFPLGPSTQSNLLQSAIASQNAGPSPLFEQHVRPISSQERATAQPIRNELQVTSNVLPINNQQSTNNQHIRKEIQVTSSVLPISNQLRVTSNVRPFNNQNQLKPNVRPFNKLLKVIIDNNQNQLQNNVRPFNQNFAQPNVRPFNSQNYVQSNVRPFNNNYQYSAPLNYQPFRQPQSSPPYYNPTFYKTNNYL